MIYTLTMNPAIDYYMQIDTDLIDGEVNRANEIQFKAAGKGINVSVVLNELKIDSVAIALLGGFTGYFIKEQFENYEHMKMIEIPVDGINRINVKIHQNDKDLHINAKGPYAGKNTEESILSFFKCLNEKDYVMICGSMMKGLDERLIVKISELVHKKGAKLIIDMESLSYEILKACKPDLIKPNLYEFKLMINKDDVKEEELYFYLDQIQKDGIKNILLSLGAEGALLKTEKKKYRLFQKEIEAINSVGCGDAMLATFIGKLSVGLSVEEALKFAGAAGCAVVSTFENLTMEKLNFYLNQIHVEEI